MREIEVKILEINRKEVEDKLIAMGAKKTFDGEVDSMMFDFEDDSLKNNKDDFRIRKLGSKNIITFKEFVESKDTKIREETEVEVSDFDETVRIFEALGLKCMQRFTKHRTSYSYDNVLFEFDNLEGEYGHIPEFLEIEASDEETVFKYAKKLGFEKEDCVSWGGKKMIGYYKNKQI